MKVTRVGQNRLYTYIYTVYLMISLPKIPYVHRIYMVLANLRHSRVVLLLNPIVDSVFIGLARTVYIRHI